MSSTRFWIYFVMYQAMGWKGALKGKQCMKMLKCFLNVSLLKLSVTHIKKILIVTVVWKIDLIT